MSRRPARPNGSGLRDSYGRGVVGLLLVAGGVLWLLDGAGVVDVPVRLALAGALLLVGVALVAGAALGRHSGLIALGLVLTLALVVVSVGAPREGRVMAGVGTRTERPQAVADVADGYSLAAGRLVIDLRRLDRATPVRAEVGMGRLTVRVAQGPVRVRSQVGAGKVTVFGEDRGSGVGIRDTFGTERRGRVLDLDLRVGFGEIEVVR